jgi:hypothetical protein
LSTPKYLKLKGTPDNHPHHVWTAGLAARGDMEPFEPRESETAEKFRAKSCGFGRFKVINGAEEPVSDAMTKEEAEAKAAEMNEA